LHVRGLSALEGGALGVSRRGAAGLGVGSGAASGGPQPRRSTEPTLAPTSLTSIWVQLSRPRAIEPTASSAQGGTNSSFQVLPPSVEARARPSPTAIPRPPWRRATVAPV